MDNSTCLELALEGERLCKAGDCRYKLSMSQVVISKRNSFCWMFVLFTLILTRRTHSLSHFFFMSIFTELVLPFSKQQFKLELMT
jgi:hypothetical protein